MKEFDANLSVAKTTDELAAKMKLNAEKMDGLVFNSYSVTGLGKEDVMCGAITALKANTLSKALKGQNAVYVICVTEIKPAQGQFSKSTQSAVNISLSSRVDYEAYEAQKTLAGIEDHKAKFDF
jgi:peptidyl-prolyl cis-trans isomerase D